MARPDVPPHHEPGRGVPPPPRATPSPPAMRDNRSLGDLLKELLGETRTLIKQEVQLAKTEASQKASKAGKHIGFLVAGGAVAFGGFLALVMALGFLLAVLLDAAWLGFLITGLLVLLAGGLLVQKGRKGLARTDFSLDHTAQTLQEDKTWMHKEVQDVKDDPAHLGSQA